MTAGDSAAMSGFSIWGHDIGGYQNANFTPAPADLFMRWAQFGAFTPIMQMHRQVNPANLQQYPHPERDVYPDRGKRADYAGGSRYRARNSRYAGTRKSSAPWITSVGAVIAASRVLVSCARATSCWAR